MFRFFRRPSVSDGLETEPLRRQRSATQYLVSYLSYCINHTLIIFISTPLVTIGHEPPIHHERLITPSKTFNMVINSIGQFSDSTPSFGRHEGKNDSNMNLISNQNVPIMWMD